VADVKLSGVGKAYGDVKILKGIDLEIRDGEFMVFVGPSGCGKSTLLRMIAGLEDITEGELRIGGRVVNDVPPAERGIAMVFQSYALYPHMNRVRQHGLRAEAGRVPPGRDRRPPSTTPLRSCTSNTCCSASPRNCRAASASAWPSAAPSCASPRSFSSTSRCPTWTPPAREDAHELAKLHEQLGKTTMVYVTHDQVEAMTLADRIVVLQAGRIEQVGAPMELYEHPCNLFVAGFIGSPGMNILEATVEQASAHGATVRLGGGETIRCAVDASAAKPGDPVKLGVRPEHLRAGVADNALQTTVTFVESLGSMTYAYCSNAGAEDVVTAAVEGDRGWTMASAAAGRAGGEDLPLQRARPRFPAPRGGRTSACGLNAARWRC
jgi:multiple sugar transport system ATP-binding protein